MRNKGDKYHKKLLRKILKEGTMDKSPRPKYADGTPANTISINHWMVTYDIAAGETPFISLRPIAWKSAIKEIFWIYQMESNKLSDLHDLGVHYWDDWDVGDGTIGARYGYTVHEHNLMNKLLDGIKKDPYGRRHILSLWQDDDFEKPGLNPCCFMNIYNVRNSQDGEYLDCMMIQRSSDFATSGTINEIQYLALQMMIANLNGYKVGQFTHVIDNAHIYMRHMDSVNELLNRKSLGSIYLMMKDPDRKRESFQDFTIDDFFVSELDDKYDQLQFELAI